MQTYSPKEGVLSTLLELDSNQKKFKKQKFSQNNGNEKLYWTKEILVSFIFVLVGKSPIPLVQVINFYW